MSFRNLNAKFLHQFTILWHVCFILGNAEVFSKFLGAFRKKKKKLIKTTIGFVMPVRLSVRIEQLGYHRTDFQ